MTSLPHARLTQDPKWISLFHAGDRSLLEACYRQHRTAVSRGIRALVPAWEEESVVHDVFCRLLDEPALRAGFQGGSFGAWLTTLSRNQALNHRRRRVRERPIEEEPEALEERTPESDVHFQLFVEAFRRDVLPAKLHPLFEARFLRHLTQQEAADCLGLSRTTLAYQESRVRRLIAKALHQGEL
jgi:RNA polymerase sigma-70 factor (ECF subfamily)